MARSPHASWHEIDTAPPGQVTHMRPAPVLAHQPAARRGMAGSMPLGQTKRLGGARSGVPQTTDSSSIGEAAGGAAQAAAAAAGGYSATGGATASAAPTASATTTASATPTAVAPASAAAATGAAPTSSGGSAAGVPGVGGSTYYAPNPGAAPGTAARGGYSVSSSGEVFGIPGQAPGAPSGQTMATPHATMAI